MKTRSAVHYIAVLSLCLVTHLAQAETYDISGVSFGNGAGTMASAGFATAAYTGVSTGESYGSSYRAYAGIAPAETAAPAITSLSSITNNIVFADESPASTEELRSTSITFKLTIQAASDETIGSVSYKFCNTSSTGLAAAPMQTDISTDTVIIPHKKVVYKIVFPSAAGALTISENNYIQIFAKNSSGADAPPAVYRLRIVSNDALPVTILQPDAKTGLAASTPILQARFTVGSIDAASIQFLVTDALGAVVHAVSAATHAGLSPDADGIVTYRYDGPALAVGSPYRLTVTAVDRNTPPLTSTATVTFAVQAGAIADLVAYPSPFDPRREQMKIRYVLAQQADVSVTLYNTAGKVVKSVIDNQPRAAGLQEESWSGENYAGDTLANGVYCCEIVVRDSAGEHRKYSSVAIFGN
jgi:hypothetical protein